jgi:MinD-like ATPase involved in chromosome partitioning or flagellar assembly
MRTNLRPEDEPPRTQQGSIGRPFARRPGEFPVPELREAQDEPVDVASRTQQANGQGSDEEPRPQVRPSISRSHVYTRPVVDGRVVSDNIWTRLRTTLRTLLTSNAEREEAQLEHALRTHAGVTRTNTIASVSPKGGVGKTTCTFVISNLLASHLKLRALAIDTNPDHGTLASLAPDRCRVDRSLSDLLNDLDGIHSAPELFPYVSRLPSGLHVLASPTNPHVMKDLTPERYGDLLAFLSRYYDVVMLDLGTGITEPLPQFAIERVDQVVVISTPEFVTVDKVLGALNYLRGDQGRDRLTLALNMAPPAGSADRKAIEAAFARQQIASRVTIPFDQRLRTMLDSGTYSLEGLQRRVRMPGKQLGIAVARQLV